MQKVLYKTSYEPGSSVYLAMQPFQGLLFAPMASASGICSFALPSHFAQPSDFFAVYF